MILGVLGAIALCFLIIKRYRENPLIRRSWTIWLLDTSKQVAGMVFVHFINVIWEGGHINYSWRLLSLKLRLVQTQFHFWNFCRIRLFPTLISEIKWLGSGLSLTYFFIYKYHLITTILKFLSDGSCFIINQRIHLPPIEYAIIPYKLH